MNENFDNKAWLEYIKKLNDRELSKKSASGLTMWALMGFFAFLFFRTIEALPVVLANKNNFFVTLIFIAYTINFIDSLLPTINIISDYFSESSPRKLLTKISDKSYKLALIVCSFPLIIGASCNLFISHESSLYNLHKWTYAVFGIWELIQFFVVYLFLFIFNNGLKKSTAPKVEFNIYYTKENLILSIFSIVQTIFFLLIFYFQVRNFIEYNSILQNIEFLKISLEFLCIFLCFIIFAYKHERNMQFSWLLSFERRIIIENLSNKQILEEFTNEFIGKTTLNWLIEIENSIMSKMEELNIELDEMRSKYIQVSDQDNLTLEEKVDLLELNVGYLDKLLQSLESLIDYVNKDINRLNDFKNRGPLTTEEKMVLCNFLSKFKDNYFSPLTNLETELTEKSANQVEQISVLKESLNNILANQES